MLSYLFFHDGIPQRDVYKRQGCSSLFLYLAGASRFAFGYGGFFGWRRRCSFYGRFLGCFHSFGLFFRSRCFLCFGSVSYTHLDVYKRQLYALACEYHTHTDRYILCDWHAVFLPAFQCENDVSFDIHNWVCLKIHTQKYTPKVRYAKILRDILFYVYFVITW